MASSNQEDLLTRLIRCSRTIEQSTHSLIPQFCDLQRRFAHDIASLYDQLDTVKEVANIVLHADKMTTLKEYKPTEKIELVVCGDKSSGKSSIIQELLGCGSFLPASTNNTPQRHVKLSYAPAGKACLLIHPKEKFSRSSAHRIELPMFSQTPRPAVQLRRVIQTNVLLEEDAIAPDDWTASLVEICLPAPFLYWNIDIYEIAPGADTKNLHFTRPCFLLLHDQLRFAFDSMNSSNVLLLNDVSVDRILRFAFQHVLRPAQHASAMMLDAIDDFFDFVLITNRRSPSEWNHTRDEALHWTQQFFQQYRLQVDTLGDEVHRQLIARFHQQREQLVKKVLAHRKQRHGELQKQVSGLSVMNALQPIELSIEKNFLRELIRDAIVRPVLHELFDQISRRVSEQVDQNLLARRSTQKNELIRTVYREFLNRINAFDDKHRREPFKKQSLREILAGITGLLNTLGTIFSLTELEVDGGRGVDDDLGKIEQSFAKIGERIKRNIRDEMQANETFFREQIDVYHRLALATMDRRQQAYQLARTFAADFARLECQLVANAHLTQHFGTTPTIEFGLVLDRGGFFSVHPASWDADRDLVAKALLHPVGSAPVGDLEGHFHRAITRFRIEHLVPLHSLYYGDRLCILLPRYPHSLHSYLTDHMADLSMKEAMRIVLHVSRAVAQLHAHNFVHRDVKAQNILMDNDRNVFLADFGTCQHGATNMTIVGSRPVPPELDIAHAPINFSYQGTAVDVFALGILMFSVVPKEVYYQPLQTVTAEEIRALTHVPERYRALITACIQREWKLRPSAADVVERLQTIADQVAQAKECLMCFEHPIFSRCLPCGHKTVCGKCLASLHQRGSAQNPPQCILCRQEIVRTEEDGDNCTFAENHTAS